MNANDPQRLLGQHPAALRSVHFDGAAHPEALGHLEVETKHGIVLVFDHRRPVVYASPPAPPGLERERRWRDLTAAATAAFDNRPTFSGVTLIDDEQQSWRFELSTGAELLFALDATRPSLKQLLLPL